MTTNAISRTIRDGKITFVLNIDDSGVPIPANDNSESHTEQEWKELFKQKQKELDSDAFGKWWNTVYPF